MVVVVEVLKDNNIQSGRTALWLSHSIAILQERNEGFIRLAKIEFRIGGVACNCCNEEETMATEWPLTVCKQLPQQHTIGPSEM